MADLTSKQRAHLRKLAHALSPTVHVGKEGITEAALRGLRQTFATHELVKVRVLEAAPEAARETAYALAEGIDGAAVVQVVGRNATLYRPLPEESEAPAPPPVMASPRRTPPKKQTPFKKRASSKQRTPRGGGRGR